MAIWMGRELPGLFIVIEGLDGAGTTTQTELLQRRLFGAIERRPHITHEPTDGHFGRLMRAAVQGDYTLNPSALALGFAADRLDHLHRGGGILERLTSGQAVISDRYTLSSFAYQAAQDVDLEWLISVNSKALVPDLTVFVDAEIDTCLSRISHRPAFQGDIFHEDNFLRRARTTYKRVLPLKNITGRLAVVDGESDIESVSDAIWNAVSSAFKMTSFLR